MKPTERDDLDRMIAAIIQQKAIEREVRRRIQRRGKRRGALLGFAIFCVSAALVIGAIWMLW